MMRKTKIVMMIPRMLEHLTALAKVERQREHNSHEHPFGGTRRT